MKAANASKYGLSEEYLTKVAPTMMQHEGPSNFGVMQASALSALIGKRQKDAAKQHMHKFGLLGKHDTLVDEDSFVNNPYKWAEANLRPALEKHGVKTDEEHRGGLVKAITQMFSNRKVGEYFTSMLVNSSIIGKDSKFLDRAQGTEGAATARSQDGFKAAESINTQLKDAAAAFLNLGPVIKGMNAIADRLSAGVNKFDQGSTADKTGMTIAGGVLAGGAAAAGVKGASMAYQWFTGAGALTGSAAALDASAAALTAAAAELAGGKALDTVASKLGTPAAVAAGGAGGGFLSKMWGAGAAALPFVWPAAVGVGAYYAAEGANDYSGITKESTRARMRRHQAKYNWWGKYIGDQGDDYSLGSPEVSPTMTYGTGAAGDRAVTVSGEVHGTTEVTIKVEAGSTLISIVEAVRKLSADLYGSLAANGPGSAGHSSYDAAPGFRPPSGFPGY